jgi:acyl-CoA synthetase (AMP-forming)/AMP-acid ligase II
LQERSAHVHRLAQLVDPLRFLERSAEVYPDKVAIVHGDRRTSYRDFAFEATRLGRALQASGIDPGDRVAYLCPNIPELLVAHFAVPLAGAVLVAINTRLAPEEVLYICDHSGARLLVVDSELRSIIDPVERFRDRLARHSLEASEESPSPASKLAAPRRRGPKARLGRT